MKILNATLIAGMLFCATPGLTQEPLAPPPDPYPPQEPANAPAANASDTVSPATPALEYGAVATPQPAVPAAPVDPQFFVAPTDPAAPAAPAVPLPTPAPDLPFPDAPPVPMAEIAAPPLLTEIPPSAPAAQVTAPAVDVPPVPAAPAAPMPDAAALQVPVPVPPPVAAPQPPPPVIALPPVVAPAPLPRPRGPQTIPNNDSAPPPAAARMPNSVITDDSFSDPLYTSIYFGRGSSELSDTSLNKLRRQMPDLLKNIDRYPRLVVELAGHADASEKGDLQFLSRNRAEMLRALLVARGVPGERIRISAHGGSKPLRGAAPGRNSRVEVLTYPL